MNPPEIAIAEFDDSIGLVYEEQIYAAAMVIPGSRYSWQLALVTTDQLVHRGDASLLTIPG